MIAQIQESLLALVQMSNMPDPMLSLSATMFEQKELEMFCRATSELMKSRPRNTFVVAS